MSKRFNAALFVLASLPKTIYFNFKTLTFRQAIHLPILIGYNIKILKANKHVISFPEDFNNKTFTVRFGFGGTEVVPNRKGMIRIASGKCIFRNEDCFASGIVLDVNGGILEFGNNFSANRNCFISCSKDIKFDDSVMTGWNVTVRDSDGHLVAQNHSIKDHQRPVRIGKHVWLCSFCTLLKGVTIGDNSIVGYGALVTKSFEDKNILVAGSPAKLIQTNVAWAHIGEEDLLL